jgi:hypothetical protein
MRDFHDPRESGQTNFPAFRFYFDPLFMMGLFNFVMSRYGTEPGTIHDNFCQAVPCLMGPIEKRYEFFIAE